MKSLKDWNDDILRMRNTKAKPNSIACPICSKELWDTAPNMLLTSNPLQLKVHCPSCGYKGYRYTV